MEAHRLENSVCQSEPLRGITNSQSFVIVIQVHMAHKGS
jgi:hypothetical protein